MTRRGRCPVVAVVGAGAAGSLTALHLTRAAARQSTGLEILLVDPAERWGRGTAFGTTHDRHLLNVPAAGMSALPEDPSHFVSWRRRDDQFSVTEPYTFAPRRDYARYLDQCLTQAVESAFGEVSVQHVRRRARALRRTPDGVALGLEGDVEVEADAAVIATGLPAASSAWAPDELRRSAFFVADPWAPGALETVRRDRAAAPDVLLVGTGLTMVDVALSLADDGSRPDRSLLAISRGGRLPHVHADELRPAAIPDVSTWGHTLADLKERVTAHLTGVAQATGDWRPGMDGLRFRAATLWGRLDDADRAEFLASDAAAWNVLRHRMAPDSAALLSDLQSAGRLTVSSGEVAGAEPLTGGGVRVTLVDGTAHDVGWVVNCTGPRTDVRLLGDPLLDDLLRPRGGAPLAVTSTAGMGLQTVDGRLVDGAGECDAPIWTLGALRRGELWESTAVPEIRSQALALATSVLHAVAPKPRRLADGRLVSGRHPVARPRDPLGLPLSTTAEAAASFNAGLERVMRLQSGAEDLLREAAVLDPDFALAHAALAMLGHEAGADADVKASLEAARRAVRRRGDDRERSWVEVVGQRVKDVRHAGASALMSHIARHPRDVLAVSAAVPTIAFSGVTDVQQEAWELVEGLAPAFGDHWWYISLLAFTRQDQSRFDEAGLLAESALSCEPSSGHAVHAQTHVLYETGQHETGRAWLDHWVTESGRSASHRAHFSWHAALHELALDDVEAVRRRYYSQLSPPTVNGVRALVDSASLLWRWHVTTTGWDEAATPIPPVEHVVQAVDASLLTRPQTPFIALHAAAALAAAGDGAGLDALASHCRKSSEAATRGTVASICDAFVAVTEERWAEAARLLTEVLPTLARVGGSAAQREVVEETLLFCLVQDGQSERALALLDGRLDRRASPLDRRRRESLARPAPAMT